MLYAAHISEDGRIQTVKEHLEGTASRAREYAGVFDAADLGYLAGMLHDIGKYSEEFQNRIYFQGPKTDHSTAGAYECMKRQQFWASFSIAGHHAGLPDAGSRADFDNAALLGRIEKARNKKIPDYSHWEEEVELDGTCKLPDFCMKDAKTGSFFGRMLFSCLVDADFIDTEEFMDGDKGSRYSGDSIADLKCRLDEYVSHWFPPSSMLNEKRCEILNACINAGSSRTGLFTLTVPTGGGKTVASLAFALNHALHNGLSRVIYVIPYTSIIEQTAEVFRRILGDGNVLEHHSGADFDTDEDAGIQGIKLRKAAENWDMPVIVTTSVQFFESLFSNKVSKCRKLHNIANSVVIFDEAQMIPLSYLNPCVYAISQLTAYYHTSAVLCTATQPALGRMFRNIGAAYDPIDICPPKTADAEIFSRVVFSEEHYPGWDKVAEKMNSKEQILCIVNTRKNARKVYEKLKGPNVFHLSTLLTPKSRKDKLKKIRDCLEQGIPCKVVSTSLIEAGVDVDFPEVMREIAGLDSILQSAGRCNREGKRRREDSVVTVFSTREKVPELFAVNAAAAKTVIKEYKDYSSRKAVSRYYQELYDLKGDDAFDVDKIMRLVRQVNVPYKKIAEKFHLIGDSTFTVYIIQDKESEDLIRERLAGQISREMMRKLNQYAVNIYEQHKEALYKAGDISMLDDGCFYLNNRNLYNEETGLSL